MSSLIDANLGFLACGSRNRQEVESCEKRKRLKIQERGLKFWFWRPIWDQYDRDESENSSDQIFETETRRFSPFSRQFRDRDDCQEAHPKWTGLVVCGILFYSFQRESISGEGKGRGGIDVSALIKKKKTVVTGGSSSRHTSNWVGGSGGNNILKSKAKRHKKRRVGDSASSVARGHTSCCCCLLSR